ncbi:hypothetical protein EJB05_10064, partial [Eragrostis curvula]
MVRGAARATALGFAGNSLSRRRPWHLPRRPFRLSSLTHLPTPQLLALAEAPGGCGRLYESTVQTKTSCPPCSLGGQREGCSEPKLPEEIWCHIHSLLPMRDAARAACVSKDFVRSWRFRPHLTFNKETLGLDHIKHRDQMRHFTNIVDNILKNHSGIGIKSLKFDFGVGNDKEFLDHLDSWLQSVIKPGIQELELYMPLGYTLYNFPVSLLSGGTGASLRSFVLINCKFQPSSCILSNTPALETLDVRGCFKLIRIRIPCLQQLNYLAVSLKHNVKLMSEAPNLSSLHFEGEFNGIHPPGRTLQIKKLHMLSNNAIFKACMEFPSVMPNLETLTVHSDLEVLILYRRWVSVLFYPPDLSTMPVFHHDKLKNVRIDAFTHAKQYIEFTYRILESATSLERLTLNTGYGMTRCSGKCGSTTSWEREEEARRSAYAIKMFIEPKVPSTVELNVLGP